LSTWYRTEPGLFNSRQIAKEEAKSEERLCRENAHLAGHIAHPKPIQDRQQETVEDRQGSRSSALANLAGILSQGHIAAPMKPGKSGFGSSLSWESFAADEESACFIAYYAARCNLRSEFTIAGQQKPYDEIAEMLLSRCRENATTNWWAIAHVYPSQEVLMHLSDEQKGELLGRWFTVLQEIAILLEETWKKSQIKRETMVVRRGNYSSTWNTMASAWNRARDHWIALLYALGMETMLEEICPGNVLRLMAADVVAWHYRTGGKLDPNTHVWNELPLPWEVLAGEQVCTRQTVEEICRKHDLDPEKSGWSMPRPRNRVAQFRPTPELVHGITVGNPYLATFLRKAGFFSGKHIKQSHLH